MPRFKTKPQIVEGWKFQRELLEDKTNVPDWVASTLKIVAGRFVVEHDDGFSIEILDGQWLMRLDTGIFPIDQEALENGFEPIFDEASEVKGNA